MPRIDPSKLGGWYGAHAPALTLYARQWAGPAAEDIVHEAFIRLLSQPHHPDNVKAWLYKTVRNAAIGHLRADKRRDRRQRALTESRPQWFLPRPDDLLDASAAQDALATLPDDQREVVVLRIWSQASFAEIADLTASPLSSVYDRYRAGLASLKQKLESRSCKNT